MTDPLKLPLKSDGMEIIDGNGWLIARSWWARGETTDAGANHRAEIIVAALTADAEPTPAVVMPPVDYTKIPCQYEGKWVLIDINSQQVASSGDSPEDATAGFGSESLEFVLTQVPAADTKPWIYHSEQDSDEYADAEKGEDSG